MPADEATVYLNDFHGGTGHWDTTTEGQLILTFPNGLPVSTHSLPFRSTCN